VGYSGNERCDRAQQEREKACGYSGNTETGNGSNHVYEPRAIHLALVFLDDLAGTPTC